MLLENLVAVIVIGIAANLDNAGIGIAYGIRKIHIPLLANAMIALISFLATLLTGIAGHWLTLFITPFFAHLVGTIIMVSVGVWVLYQPFSKQSPEPCQQPDSVFTRILRNPEEADFDKSQTISFKESIFLGIALAMNALASGFFVGVTSLYVWGTSLVVGFFSFSLLALSTYLGRKFASEKLGDKATIISGVLLIIIGISQLF